MPEPPLRLSCGAGRARRSSGAFAFASPQGVFHAMRPCGPAHGCILMAANSSSCDSQFLWLLHSGPLAVAALFFFLPSFTTPVNSSAPATAAVIQQP